MSSPDQSRGRAAKDGAISRSEPGDLDLSQWPSVGEEDADWDVHPVSGMSRQDRRWIGRPYRAPVVPEIALLSPIVSSQVAAEAEEAAAAISRFDTEMGDQLAPYAAVLLRGEAASSSQIEGITAMARAILEAEVNGHGSQNAELIVSNAKTMTEALRVTGGVDSDRILKMHEALLRESHPSIGGRYRDDQVWIGGRGMAPHTADFVPPVADRVLEAINDLSDFLDRDDLPVVIQTAVAHAQFETIHPFPDGNGRTGRALMHAVLVEKGLVKNAAIPVSAGLLVRRGAYIDALTAYREGQLDPIVSEVSRAALLATTEGRRLVSEAKAVRDSWAKRMTSVRADSGAHRLADGLVRQPVVSAKEVGEILGTGRNVYRHIEKLIELGILQSTTDRKTRNMSWRAQDVLDVLDDYSERIGRRVC